MLLPSEIQRVEVLVGIEIPTILVPAAGAAGTAVAAGAAGAVVAAGAAGAVVAAGAAGVAAGAAQALNTKSKTSNRLTLRLNITASWDLSEFLKWA